MKVFALSVLALMLMGASLPTSGDAVRDPLKDQLVAAARAVLPSDLAFDRVTRLVRVGGGTTTRQVRVERWDGTRWTLVSINDRRPTAADVAKVARVNIVPGYHELARILAASSEQRIDAEGRTVLIVPALPTGSVVADGKDISPHLKAEAVLGMRDGRPWVEQLRVSDRESFKLNMLIKVTNFEQVNNYRLDGQGVPRLMAQQNDSVGSMFGFSGGEKSEVVYAYR